MAGELSRRRRIGILLICSMSLLIVGLDVDHRQRRPALDRTGPARAAVGPAMDGGRLHPGARQPAHALGLDRRPPGAPAHLRDRAAHLRGGLTALQPGPQPDHADRLPHGPGRGRIDAESGGDVDHHQHLHHPPGAGPGDRGLGRGGRGVHGPRPGGGWAAGEHGRLAVDLLDQHPRRVDGGGPCPALHPGVQSSGGEEGGRPRAGARDHAPGLAHLRHHRSPRAGAGPQPSSSVPSPLPPRR